MCSDERVFCSDEYRVRKTKKHTSSDFVKDEKEKSRGEIRVLLFKFGRNYQK